MEKTLVLESGQCALGQCIFCGYSKQAKPVDEQYLRIRLDEALADAEGAERLKMFTSGSFLDDCQFPPAFRAYFVEKVKAKKIKEVTIESIPQFITAERLAEFKGVNLTVAIGLEVADNRVLAVLKKGFTVEQYVEAAKTLHANGCKLRTYLLVNPPGATDVKRSIEESVAFAKKYSDSIVAINLLPHSRAPLFDMWLEGAWKPLPKARFHELVDALGVETDDETFRFTPKFPPEKKQFIKGVGVEFIDHPHYNVWQDFITSFYDGPRDKDIALFVPCAAKKPYSESKTHQLIFSAMRRSKNFRRIHRIVISSPGVIPFEFSDYYPFNSYDWDEKLETPEIMKEYVRINKQRAVNYLKAHKYKHVACFFKPTSESYEALREACAELGIKLVAVLPEAVEGGGNPLFRDESLDKLVSALDALE
jgi:pyruvate-formate lyase-activating enzyme